MLRVLSLLMIVGLKKQHDIMFMHFNAVPITIVTVSVYGALIECVQILIPGRYFEWQDMVANGFGALLGFGLFYRFISRVNVLSLSAHQGYFFFAIVIRFGMGCYSNPLTLKCLMS